MYDSRHGKISIFSTVSRLALGPTHLPVQWVLGTDLPAENWAGS
jgi:hypothetical protein